MKHNIRILYTNIQSIRRHYNEMLLHLNNISTNYDILALSETWLDDGDSNLFAIDGYTMYTQARVDGR